jgi:5-methylcytosine-specific restriction endonuclease McrA
MKPQTGSESVAESGVSGPPEVAGGRRCEHCPAASAVQSLPPGRYEQYFEAAAAEHVKREKAKARELRESAWWKNQRGRGVCHYCGQRVQPQLLTMEHIVPIVRGGRSTKGNVVPCCKACNTEKKYRLPLEWEEHMERLRGGGPAAAP